MPLDSSAVPNEIWFEIAMLSDFKAVLALEATCKFLRDVVLNRLFWLECLRALEQDHAPDLPHHVSISDLSLEKLRTLVVRVHRRLLNCTGPAPVRHTRETTICVGSENSDDEPGGKHDLVHDMELLPGGSLLLVLWVSGYLQCWTVPGGECLWTYRPPGSRVVLDSGFAYEMQADGDVRVLVVSEPYDWDTSEKTFEIFQISPHLGKTPKLLYTYQTEPDPVMRSVDVARLSGDVLAVSILGTLLVTFWREDRTVVILDCFFEDVHLVDGYIIGVLQHYPDRSIIAISLSSIRNIRPSASDSRVAQVLTLGRDIPYSSCLIPQTSSDFQDSAKLSICTFHWKPEAERKRKGIHITLSADINKDYGARPTVDSFLLDIPTDTAGKSEFGSNDHLPSITHLERPGTMILYQRPSLYSNMSRPSQDGSMVIEFYADYEWVKRPNEWILATVSCGEEVACRTLEMPHARNAKVEFYSGALCFVMKNHKSIVIQYFD